MGDVNQLSPIEIGAKGLYEAALDVTRKFISRTYPPQLYHINQTAVSMGISPRENSLEGKTLVFPTEHRIEIFSPDLLDFATALADAYRDRGLQFNIKKNYVEPDLKEQD